MAKQIKPPSLSGQEAHRHVVQVIAKTVESNATNLRLVRHRITQLPDEIANAQNLTSLEVSLGLNEVTAAIGKLKQLKTLNLNGNVLSTLPAELSELTNLENLILSGNHLDHIPDCVLALSNLQYLALSANQITSLPQRIDELKNLQELRVSSNKLSELPTGIGNIENLTILKIRGNKLTHLPYTIGNLKKLQSLDLRNNPIVELPTELGRCQSLTELRLNRKQRLAFPPTDIADLGTPAIVRYLRAADIESEIVWESKLLLVGEGAVGKTWLYEALNNRMAGGNRKGEGATIGIEIGPLHIEHPQRPEIMMRLNCWDFAGQDINHATHQFFFSERTLFLLCWNARAGWEAGKLRKWLTNIRDRAPGARVILIATHADQPHSDYPEKELQAEFSQIVATFKVSSESGEGIASLRSEISKQAAELPMMGLRWPKAWRAAQQSVVALGRTEPYATLTAVLQVIQASGLERVDAEVLLRWLHELGEVLHYAEVAELSDIVMLDPQWVTRRVGEILASTTVQKAKGLLTREFLDELWPDVSGYVRQHLLGMMERFDLAYRIPDDIEHRCLVVERLPQNPPDYERRWEEFEASTEIRLRYRLKAMHPGIPTWFIARCHRFTLGLHWLRGVLFGDSRHHPRHLALVTANDVERTVSFNVRGPKPWSFLPLLTDGFEDTVRKRYPGLEFERTIPCAGKRRDDTQCDFEFDLKDLEGLRWPREAGIESEHNIRCTRCRTLHSIDTLLLGLSRESSRDTETLQQILTTIKDEGERTRTVIASEAAEARKFIQLAFVQEWNEEQDLEERSCPTVFALFPIDGRTITRNSKVRLQLFCMSPDCWHSIGEAGRCDFELKREWLIAAARWTTNSLRWLRPAAALLPSGSQLVGEYSESLAAIADSSQNELKLTAEVFKQIKDPRTPDSQFDLFSDDRAPKDFNDGADIGELKKMLERLEFPKKPFGGLKRIRTPEGHVLWLCAEHADNFARLT